MRLIDADGLDETFSRLNDNGWQLTRGDHKRMESVLFEMPTIDAADVRPVARGRKEKAQQQPYFRGHFPTFVCSECHREVNKRWNFCPNCGARMDGGVNDGKADP